MVPILILVGVSALWANATWAHPWCVRSAEELQDKLDEAEQNGQNDEIRIQQGIYSRNGNFAYSATENYSLTIRGGYTVGEPGCESRVLAPANTVLDAKGAGRVLLFFTENAPNADFEMEGIRIVNGDTTPLSNDDGGGLLVAGEGGVVLSNNVFENNLGYHGGGAYIRADGEGDIKLSSNTFIENESSREGGGLSLATRFSDGQADISLTDNVISNNRAGNKGGGIYIDGDSSTVELDSNRFSGNVADDGGGGAYMNFRGHTTQVVLADNLIHGNSTPWIGGGLYIQIRSEACDVYLTNNTITGNEITGNDQDDSHSGGLFLQLVEDNTRAYLFNNIIWGNVDKDDLRVADLSIDNDGDDNNLRSEVEIANNDFDQSSTGFNAKIAIGLGTTNQDNADPLFVDAGTGDLHLRTGSSVIDKGGSQAPQLPTEDADGNARTNGSAPDMGAYEHQGPQTHVLLTVNRSGGGSVVSTPGGIDCGGDCKESYPLGTLVGLVVNPTPGLSFVGWGGACNGTGACSINMDSVQWVTASFADTVGDLNLDVDDNGRADALTDGMLVLRYLFGYRGKTLIEGALSPDANRNTAADIEAYLGGVMP